MTAYLNLFFTIVVVSYPILGMYMVGGSPITLSDLLLMLLMVCKVCFLDKERVNASICKVLIPYLIYVFFNTLFAYFIYDDFNRVGTSLRYLLFLSYLVFFIPTTFVLNSAFKLYKIVAVLSTFFLFVQFITFNYWNKFIPGYLTISFLPIVSDQVFALKENIQQTWFTGFRPSSFFAEPAHYAEYVIGYLVISLFVKREKNLAVSVILSLGILVSMASTGIISAIIVWTVYLMMELKDSFSFKRLFCLFALVPLIVYCVLNTDFWLEFDRRMSMGFDEKSSAGGRFLGYVVAYQNMGANPLKWLFGQGMSSDGFPYLAGFSRLFVYFGVVGCFIFFLISLYVLLCPFLEKWQKIFFMSFIMLNTGTELLFQPMIVVFVPFFILLQPNYLKSSKGDSFVEINK